jgi:hypothetical protein
MLRWHAHLIVVSADKSAAVVKARIGKDRRIFT